jgi:ATP-dependent DNA ligase
MSSLRPRTLPAGFIPPCLPTAAPRAPSGDQWWHEIKHDGIRVIARKEDKRVRLFSRPGNDLTDRFPLIVEALGRLRARSCILDGEAVAFLKRRDLPYRSGRCRAWVKIKNPASLGRACGLKTRAWWMSAIGEGMPRRRARFDPEPT